MKSKVFVFWLSIVFLGCAQETTKSVMEATSETIRLSDMLGDEPIEIVTKRGIPDFDLEGSVPTYCFPYAEIPSSLIQLHQAINSPKAEEAIQKTPLSTTLQNNHVGNKSSRLVFSHPAISDDSALLYVDYQCPLCGWGGFFFLRKSNNWIVVDKCMIASR